ncbi:MAG: fibronectin type III domain-containing protein [Paludibacteraceae bacterium]|nr:fibronectin type III domain-containing protein [Paludibacteraceae bacterium]
MTNVYFNFNGSFGIDATSSQCRANVEPTSRDKLFLPHLWKHVAMIFAVLVMSMANIGMAWGASTTVEFKTSTKDDSNVALAALANGDTRLVGGGLAKLIAANSVAISTTANKYGYRCDASRLYIVFKFDGETDLTIRHNVNSTGARYMRLYSFSSAKALSAITSSDWGTKTQKSFSSTNSSSTWGSGQASVVTTNGDKTTWSYTTKGCLTVTWEDLPAGYYVLDGTGSEAYIYSFTADVTAASCTAPDSVGVSGTWDRFGGETISLTATAYDDSDNEIAAANITGYQWQKLLGSTWTDVANGGTISGATAANLVITNCTKDHSGKYRCIVSTGATCSTASATATDGSEGFKVKVFTLDCYNGGVTSYNFTRTGNTQTGTVTVNLAASTSYEFEVVGDDDYYGNTGTINEDVTNWEMTKNAGHLHINSGLGGTFTFAMDYSSAGNNAEVGIPELSVTYPRKRIYLSPGVWDADGAKFAYNYFRDGGSGGWTNFLISDDCGMYADIPQWNGVKMIAVRLKNTTTTPNWDDKWNQTGDLAVTSNDYIVVNNWDNITYNSTYSAPTYTISYNAGTGGSGSKANETKTCGVDFTLPNSAVFTRTGYTQTGWTTSNGGSQTHALGGSYTTNAAQTFYPVWTVNQYSVTHTLSGVTKSSGATGANAATYGTNYTAGFAASSGYALPESITVTIGGSTKTQGTEYTWNQATGMVTIMGSYITGDIVITVTGETTCAISSCGNATLTYAINVGTSGANASDRSDLVSSATSSNTTALEASISAGGTLTLSDNRNSAAITNTCYPSKPAMTSKISVYNGTSYSSSNYLQFTFTVKAGYTFTPCDIQFVVQPVSNPASFRWEVTDGASVYGYGTTADVPKGSTGGASVLTGITSPVTMNPGTYYIRLYPYYNGSNTFRLGTDVILKGTTAASGCTPPAAPTALGVDSKTTNSATLSWDGGSAGANGYQIALVSATGAGTFDWQDEAAATYTASGLTPSTTYTFKVRYKGTGGQCEFSDEVTCTFTTESPSLTALECNTRYTVQDMTAGGCGTLSTTSCYSAGLSANGKFEVLGDPSKTENAGGTPEQKTNTAQTINSISFNSFMYLKGDGLNGSTEPTCRGVKFIIPTAGRLTIYYRYGDRSKLKKEGETAVNVGTTTGGYGYDTHDVTAGTYYIYGASSGAVFIAVEYQCCTTPAAPTAFTAGSITSSGATFSITDAGDAASYDIFYSTSSDAPTASTVATTTSDSKTKSITGLTASTTYYAWVRSVCDADHKSAWVALDGASFTTSAPAATYSVTHSLTNVTATSGATGAGAATEGVAYDAVFAASSGYVLPSTITVTIGGSPATVGTGYTWNASTGAFQVPAAQVTGDIVVTIAADVAPATKDIYYGAITITTGALTRGSTGTAQFFTNIGGTIENNTEISWSSGPSTASQYYNSNNLTDTELSKSGNWSTGSSSNRYIQGFKFQSGSTYTLALGSKVASSITFYGRNGSASKTMSVGGEEWTSSATKDTHAKHEFTKSGGFTGNVSITQDGDFYGILVITIQTATPCTTPVIPALSNQSLCEGTDIAAWNATVTNATAIEAAGESIAYSWKKKGNDTELGNTATFDLGSSATESQAGTYVVTVTVSKAGKASSSAYREVELSVTEETEVTNITADKATVYAGNSVTLTATANATITSWEWYTCTNAGGDGEAIISGANSASYTIASAPAAGTYYYKVKVTSSCGDAERVYALTVSQPSECQNYYWFIYADDATANGVINNRDGFFSNTTTGTGNTGTYTMTVDGTSMTGTKRLSTGAYKPKFTVPDGATATLYIYGKAASSDAGKHLVLKRTSDDAEVEVTSNTTVQAYTKEDIEPGEWTLSCGSSNWCYSFFAVKVCSASSCTDATPTITAANTTVCVGSELSISATGYESNPTSIQWQKLNGSVWENISGATSATYTVASATASNAGSYRVQVTKECTRTSNTVTISVPAAPVFGSLGGARSVMTTGSLSINDVEASDATEYKWYKSANNTYEPGTDTEVGSAKNLLIGTVSEAAGSTFYLFCVASNSCGSTTSGAITVNVTAFVEEECATRDNMASAEFGFVNTSAGQGSYSSTACWTMNSNSKYLTYTAPEGKYFKTAKVTIASSSESKASYNWSTNGGTDYTAVSLTVNSTLTERTIDLSAHGNVNAIQIGRNFDSKGSSSGTLYVSKICFEYTDACTATTVTPSVASKTHTIGESFTSPTFTLAPAAVASGTLTYSSSDEDIATVDENGIVSFNDKSGTVTITASYAGATISETDYCASSGSYTITVSCSDEAPKIIPDGTVNIGGCNSTITLNATKQDGTTNFTGGTYQWFRNGEEIDDATAASYTVVQAGVYTVERTGTGGCTSVSSNRVTVTSDNVEPEVEHLVPFQYYHVDKAYTDQMKMRHLFAVKNSSEYGSTGKNFKLELSRNGAAATDITTAVSISVIQSADHTVDTVMIDLNQLSGKYSENDELVFTCKAVDCAGNVSDTYKDNITMHVIGATPTLALILDGKESKVGGDFLEDYNPKNLQQQTAEKTWEGEWSMYTELKEEYIVTPVNGYAIFNKLNYEPFDILFLTDFPKASKSDAAKDVLDDMAALCDYRPLFSFKTHMVAKSPSKWAAKGFTTAPVSGSKQDGRLNLNIVCYAHPMFESIKTGDDVYNDVENVSAPLVYTMLSGTGYESSKGMQGFEIDAAENFVTIGLTHFNAAIAKNSPSTGDATWTPGDQDRMLVTAAERQTNIEARMILFSLNAGAHSKLTDKGEQVVLKCLEYLLDVNPLHVADCSFTFDNGASNEHDASWYAVHCNTCTGTKGDGKWSTAANWAPDYRLLPGEFTSVRIKAPVEVDVEHAHVMEVRLIEEGRIEIPSGSGLEVKSTIRRKDGSEIYPTESSDLTIGSSSSGNGTLIFNNNTGDTKAHVTMYSTAHADVEHNSAATSTWQYIGTPHTDIANAKSSYYDSWIYQYDTNSQGWTVIPNGGPLQAFRGYCITHPSAPLVYDMHGTLAPTTSQDIAVPANKYVVAANSWVAPIDINAITDDDMEGITDKAIYFFNTGTDTEGDNAIGSATADEATRYAANTYVAAPIHASRYTGEWQIPSMQGFYVWSETAGTLHLDYSKHVRPSTSRSIVGGRMHAPKRAKAESDEPSVLKLIARGNRYDDRLIVLEREDFTRRYDSGWDGEAWGGSDLSPMVYITNEAGVNEAVSAIPEYDGTVIIFKAGEDNEYRFDFVYEGEEPLYLLDTENNTYTEIMTGNAYHFTTDDKAAHGRFILTRNAPQIATGVEPATDSSQKVRAKKILVEDKLYILLNGILYDATGKVVR